VKILLAVALTAHLAAHLATAGQAVSSRPGAEQVLVVVNTQSGLSRRIGEMYARKRQIAERQICRLRTPEGETITRAQYTALETDVADCLRRLGAGGRIHYLVLTQGVPLRVRAEKGQALESDGASVDSELTMLYQRMRGGRLAENGKLHNPYFRQRDAPFRPEAFQMYLVTRLAGYTYDDVERMIDRSLEARNQGKVVIDLRGDDDQEGNNWLRTAAILLPKERVVLDTTSTVITQVKDAIGYASWGSNDKNRRDRFLNFRWLPGAIMTEFVSFNGRTFEMPPKDWKLGSWSLQWTWFKGSPQSLTADYLHEGATGASGHVDEPYLDACPRPEVLFPAYLGGRNLAESYWMSIPYVSWMNIVVGDPLCQLR
jgi:uncharacterized protein (TIGR03790 family)